MVWRRLRRGLTLGAALGAVMTAACGREGDMPETMEVQDSMPVIRALQSEGARDSMLDTMPGGEMVRGDSAAATRLLKEKM
jgi:hypothetical protein